LARKLPETFKRRALPIKLSVQKGIARPPLRRREFLKGAAAFAALGVQAALAQEQPAPPPPAEPAPAPPQPFSFNVVRELARQAAARDYDEPDERLPDYLSEIGYDQYRDIRYRPDRALWRQENLPFEVQFFHRGFLYEPRIDIFVVSFGEVQPVIFDPGQFHYGNTVFPEPVPPDLGYAGFRLHYPLNRPDYKDEVAVFLGASYFRVLGAGQVYGSSARGLAIDTALPNGEEFPLFRRFWIERPAPGATFIRFWALLDSPSVAGAYQFLLTPGAASVIEIDCTLYARQDIAKVGLAPLTTMFFYGESDRRRPVDYRPEVHDSDGLLVAANSGEWHWRPLVNPSSLQITTVPLINPRGFGLLQRDREFADYQDLESRFELRPSYWVQPKGDWGEGVVELIEIPTDSEANDNIVAAWIPTGSMRTGQELSRSYALRAHLVDDQLPPLGRAVASRLSLHNPGAERAVRMVIDFNGGPLPGLPDNAQITAEASVVPGKLLHLDVKRNHVTSGWRISLLFEPESGDPVELRLFLRQNEQILTETWSYRWVP
jgi:glucans biosynthesis protein